jgi:Trk K+ transport system NAD-binding subunit
MEQPYIMCGLGRVGWRVLEYLRAAGLPVVLIDSRCSADDPRLGGLRLVRGDCRRKEVLEEAGVQNARGVLVMTNDDLVNISAALMIRHLNADVRIVMRLFNQSLVPRLGKAFTNIYALSTSTLTAPLFAMSALTGQALGTVHLRDSADGHRPVAEIGIRLASPLIGLPLGELARRYQVQVVAHIPVTGQARYLNDVQEQAVLDAGDRVIVCGELLTLTPLLEQEASALLDVHWAGFVRRMGRVVWRTLSEVDLPVKICTGVLIFVILVSTVILHIADERDWHQALYGTISLMATAADMHAELHKIWWYTIFASVLRLLGAAVVAAFTAILTNYLLRARLSGALEFRRIPDSGHVVVCGLGNIGFRVVEELVKRQERVVVIEQSRDSRFVATARGLGVPVLMGDATVIAVLQQAHAARARAVITATSDDLLNLGITLLVRELNPKQRVVLHMSDPQLANMLRESANVRLALSIPMLAAPSFVAALMGDRVQSVLMIHHRILTVIELVVAGQDLTLIDKTVRAVALDYGFVPVAVFDEAGSLVEEARRARLKVGYRLVVISAMADMQRLLQREPAAANHEVEITALPAGSRAGLVVRLGQELGLDAAEAEKGLEQLPHRLGKALTRGQAEDLVELLHGEAVSAQARQL